MFVYFFELEYLFFLLLLVFGFNLCGGVIKDRKKKLVFGSFKLIFLRV